MASEWNEKAVFLAALRLPEDARARYLDEACPDAEKRARIESLLAGHAAGLAAVFESAATTTAGAAGGAAAADPSGVDEFRILSRVGEGGMGVVYLAEDAILGRRVALKILAAHLADSEAARARFRDEARNTALLNHPAIVPVHKVGTDGRVHYIVSEYIEGQTLASLIDTELTRRRTSTAAQGIREWHRRAAAIAAVIADALDSAHRAGIIHRDVKPSNILVDTQGRPRLTDFGIAKHFAADGAAAQTGLIGSCHYMSPEQASVADQPLDQRTDVFSLGVVLYEMIALRRPFDGSDVHQVLQAVITHPPQRLRAIDPTVSRDLAVICHKAIEKHPRDRYQTAAHMAADLRSQLAGDPILARPPTLFTEALRWIRRRRRSVLLVAMVALSLALAAAIWRDRERTAEGLAWFTVDSADRPCRVVVHGYDAGTRRVLPTPIALYETPLGATSLSPGHYRIRVESSADDGACDFNVHLREPGRAAVTKFRVAGSGDAAGQRVVAGELLGVLRRSSEVIGAGMVHIPADVYRLGQGGIVDPLLKPDIRLGEFWIDEAEVSNRQYREFTDATGHPLPYLWTKFGYSDTIADLPVIWLTLADAEAYARFRGKRLPTLFEWQAAARGVDGRRFPTDAAPPEVKIDRFHAPGLAEALFETYTSAVRPIRSPPEWDVAGGLLHMLSNASEWTATPAGEGGGRFVAGGCWFDDPSRRDLSMILIAPSGVGAPVTGFRCAWSAGPPIEDEP